MPPQDDSKRRATVSELMRVHGEAVFGFCMRMVRHEATANDICQQTFLEAYRDLDRFEGRASVRTWLIGIAHHRCLDAIKRDQRLQRWVETDDEAVHAHADPDPGPEARLDHARSVVALEACVSRLSLLMRVAVLARFLTGATYEELADLLDASANTLQARVARALKHLRQCLEAKGVEP